MQAVARFVRRLTASAALTTLAVGGLAAIGAAPAAASTLDAAGFAQACATSPLNTVTVTDNLKIEGGSATVGTPCTVALGAGATFETVDARLDVRGPFVLRSSGDQATVKAQRGTWTARAITIDLDAGAGSQVSVEQATLRTRTGNLALSFGNDGNLQLLGGFGNGTLVSAARLDVTAGAKFFAFLGGSTSGTFAGTGQRWRMNGAEGSIVSAGGSIGAFTGTVEISSPSSKALVDVKDAVVASDGGPVYLRLTGAESVAKLSNVTVRSLGATADVHLVTGSSTGFAGALTVTGSNVVSDLGIRIHSTLNNEKGLVEVVGGTVRAGTGTDIATGRLGTTVVKDAALWWTTGLRVATGTGGACVAEANSYIGPGTPSLCR